MIQVTVKKRNPDGSLIKIDKFIVHGVRITPNILYLHKRNGETHVPDYVFLANFRNDDIEIGNVE